METSIIEMANIAIWRLEAPDGPSNAPATFDKLTKLLGHLTQGRDCYGLARIEEGILRYWACYGRKTTDPEIPGLEPSRIPAGKYIITELHNWQQQIPQIGNLFEKLALQATPEPNGYGVEYYRGNKVELWLAIK